MAVYLYIPLLARWVRRHYALINLACKGWCLIGNLFPTTQTTCCAFDVDCKYKQGMGYGVSFVCQTEGYMANSWFIWYFLPVFHVPIGIELVSKYPLKPSLPHFGVVYWIHLLNLSMCSRPSARNGMSWHGLLRLWLFSNCWQTQPCNL